ncbi:helix-turn-helix domain-containing protein [Amycolatopsis jejuensis]|uniref:helix-turn-helix domain-containing protein n=1 Tax=Amycolatopsis jejuensis TaxID=330084 RepID=UPI0005252194|nr:helix-turn-helix domain-containing protein [Amycolatopsis jejuensis]
MRATVRCLLTLPEWVSTVRVAAGAGGLDREVPEVRPTLGPDLDHDVQPGELVVVHQPVSATDWRIDAVILRVSDAGGAGVLLASGDPRKSTVQLADRLGVPLLITTAYPIDLLIAARVRLAQPALDRAALLVATHRKLGDRPYPPAEVAARLSEVIGTPVRTPDLSPQADPVPQRLRGENGVVLLAHPALLPRATRPSHWLAVEVDEQAADEVQPALAFAVAAVERWLLAQRIELERDARWRSALLGELLRLESEPGVDLQRRAEEAGWEPAGWHLGMRIATQASIDNLAHTPEVERALRAEGVTAIVIERGDGWTGWTGWTTFPEEPPSAQIVSTVARLRAAHRSIQRTVPAHMGVGRPHRDLGGLAASIAEATDAARLAAARPDLGHYLQIDELSMAQLLLEWTRTDTFAPAARALVAPLQSAQGDLVRTVGAYLDAESSLSEAAAALGVHRNTVADRIARAQALLGVDLSHRDERLALHLACRLMMQSGNVHEAHSPRAD